MGQSTTQKADPQPGEVQHEPACGAVGSCWAWAQSCGSRLQLGVAVLLGPTWRSDLRMILLVTMAEPQRPLRDWLIATLCTLQ
jgi:hypothetical protein